MKRNKKGFTIVELVIVIGVIAILSAILIPTFVNLSNKAEDARAKSEVADAYTAYVLDASDGVVGDAEDTSVSHDPLENRAQDKVYVVRGEQGYAYGESGWEKVDYTVVPADKLGAEYNGCSIYKKA